MQRSAYKAFNDSYNKFKSAQDNTNKKKAETIFEIASNKNVNKQDGEKYVGPVIKKSNGFLAAVGGYNVNSYDILTNVAKGKAYLTSPCVTIDGSSVILSTNNCSLPGKCNPPNSSYGIFEGPYLQNSMDVSGCLSSQTEQFTNYDPSNILQAPNTAYSYTQLANSNDLQNFKMGAICLNTVSTAAAGILVSPVGTWNFLGFFYDVGFLSPSTLADPNYTQLSLLPGVITPTTYNGIPITRVAATAVGPGALEQVAVECDSAAFTLTTPSYNITLTNANFSSSVNGITRLSPTILRLNTTSTPTYASSPAEFKAILEASRLPPEGSNTPYRVNITSS